MTGKTKDKDATIRQKHITTVTITKEEPNEVKRILQASRRTITRNSL